MVRLPKDVAGASVQMKSLILIPAYNCSLTIRGILSKIKKLGLDAVVVDDGSADGTGDIARSMGATVLRHEKKAGKGTSMKDGFNYILRNTPCECVIAMDGDGQHNPEEIKKFLERGASGNEGIVAGNRMASSGAMPFLRKLTNRFMSLFLSVLCWQWIADTQCGFRLIKRSCLQEITINSKNYDVESEILIKASRKGYKIASIPIETIYKGETSYINPLVDTFRFFGLLARIYFGKK